MNSKLEINPNNTSAVEAVTKDSDNLNLYERNVNLQQELWIQRQVSD